tara:strand:- start:68 stop:379 length:312 start_codon:yes stop_codon:yes gene_type:complete
MTDTTVQPDHTDHNLRRLQELEGQRVRLEMRHTIGCVINTIIIGTLEYKYYPILGVGGWEVTADDNITNVQFDSVDNVTYVMQNTPDILIDTKVNSLRQKGDE